MATYTTYNCEASWLAGLFHDSRAARQGFILVWIHLLLIYIGKRSQKEIQQLPNQVSLIATTEGLTVLVFENLCLACPTCNRHKANREIGLADERTETRLLHPQRDSWLCSL